MDTITAITKQMIQGSFDSISGITVVFYLDREFNKRLKAQTATQADITNGPDHLKQRVGGARNIHTKSAKEEPSSVLKRVLQCCALNGGIFWLSIVIFEYGLMPCLNMWLNFMFQRESKLNTFIWSWIERTLSLLFSMVWVMPLFLLSRIVNGLWFQDIADSAYKFRKGRPQPIPNISKLIADALFSIVVQGLFLIQSMVVNLIPINYVGSILCFVHMCMLYSLYSFEYKWCNMGWELHKRLTYIEHNWPYFLGFGMPLAILTQIPNSYVVSGCVFSILFPLFILSGNEATPLTNSSEIHLKLFSPVVAISNALFSKSIKQTKLPQPQTPQHHHNQLIDESIFKSAQLINRKNLLSASNQSHSQRSLR